MPDNEIKQSSTDLVGGLQPLAIPSSITLGDLAEVMNVSNVELIKEFIRRGYMLTVNEVVEYEVAASVTPSF